MVRNSIEMKLSVFVFAQFSHQAVSDSVSKCLQRRLDTRVFHKRHFPVLHNMKWEKNKIQLWANRINEILAKYTK